MRHRRLLPPVANSALLWPRSASSNAATTRVTSRSTARRNDADGQTDVATICQTVGGLRVTLVQALSAIPTAKGAPNLRYTRPRRLSAM
jgi:hypothetical protein